MQAACVEVSRMPYDTRIKVVEAQMPLKALGGTVIGVDAITDESEAGDGGDALGGGDGGSVATGGDATGTSTEPPSTGSLSSGATLQTRINIYYDAIGCAALMHAERTERMHIVCFRVVFGCKVGPGIVHAIRIWHKPT